MIDMFGRKIKVNRMPDEVPDKKETVQEEKTEPADEKSDRNLDSGSGEEIKSWKRLDKLLNGLYGISALSVYAYDFRQNLIKPKCIYGVGISRLSIESFLSLNSPTVMRKATGFEDALLYRARYISKYRADGKEYLVILSSTRFEGFSASVLSNAAALIQNAIANLTG